MIKPATKAIKCSISFCRSMSSTQTGERRSNLFNNPQLRALREKIRKEENPMNRYEADVTRMRTVKDNSESSSQSSAFRAELVYSSDLESVLSLIKS